MLLLFFSNKLCHHIPTKHRKKWALHLRMTTKLLLYSLVINFTIERSIPFGFLAAENVVGKKIAKISEVLLLIIRVFPEIILGIIIVKGFGMNALSGILTIGLHSIGMLGKLFSEAIDNMDKSPLEALDSVGANIWQKIRYGVIPNILPDFSSITLYRLDINVRSASILGLVSAGGIGSLLTIASTMWSWE